VLQDPKPFVLQTALGDFAVTYEINAFVGGTQDVAGRYNELHGHILDVFNEHGVQIMTPAYEGDPPEPKVVPRERWHESPSRRPDE
jgi:small-conductance mechanosensitive channel